MRATFFAASLLLLPAAAQAGPIVVELFTSQSCSSCPPADAVLAELASRPGIIALGMHVDYWNGLGWHDPYSQHAFTERQRAYAELLPDREVYTPELVVGGRSSVVGSDRPAVEAALAAAAAGEQVGLTLRRDGDALVAAAGSGAGTAKLWLAGYDLHHETRIGGGENGGRTLAEADIVRSLAPVAAWSGSPLRIRLALPMGEQAAVFLQAPDGRIIGAAEGTRVPAAAK
jgi:hypothetical protein